MYLCTKEDYIAMKVAMGCDPDDPYILDGYPGVEFDEEEVKQYYSKKYGYVPLLDEEGHNNEKNTDNGEHKV